MATTHHATLDGARIATLRALWPRISKALHFPPHVGRNLDALFDALCDLEGLDVEMSHVTLTIRASGQFLSKEKPERREAALQVLRDAMEAENRYDERTFVVEFG
jgi:RNAse (barnase) inhibitor barstar